MAQFVYYALALASGHFVVITMPTAVVSRDGWQALRSLDLPFVFTEAAGAFAESIVRIAEGTFTLPEGTFTIAEGIFRIIARRDMDISWLEMIIAELDTGIACHEITLMRCCMGM
ncbi:MAG TPA: hypothetical protein DCL18_04540 [Prevotella sp.]|nr:hypothetical protein [Prevotella sp.]